MRFSHGLTRDRKTLAAKDRGGLGIGSLKAQNLALLYKWNWRMHTEEKSLWSDVIKSIHGNIRKADNHISSAKICGVWNGIIKAQKETHKLCIDSSLLLRPIPVAGETIRWVWGPNNNRQFTVSSLRKLIDTNKLPISAGKWCNNKSIPKKVAVLAWRTSHERLPTLKNLEKIGITHCSMCKLCGNDHEDEDHIFLHCHTANRVWSEIKQWWDKKMVPNNLSEIINENNVLGRPKYEDNINVLINMVTIWVLWKHRNGVMFRSNKISSTLSIMEEIKLVSYQWKEARRGAQESTKWEDWRINPVEHRSTSSVSSG